MSSFIHKTVPFQHQERAVYFVFENFMRGIPYSALFMEQGTGKTKVSIDIASNLYAMGLIDGVLVIAPNGVQDQWDNEELPTHSPIPYTSHVWKGMSSNKEIKELFAFIKSPNKTIKWFLTNVEAFSYTTHLKMFCEYLQLNKILLIIDEATRIKTPDSNRTINVIQGLSSQVRVGKRLLDFTPYSKYRMVLTGTPVTNQPFDLWSIMESLKHNFFNRDYFSFCGHFGLQIRNTSAKNKKNYYRECSVAEMESIRKYHSIGKSYEDIARIMQISESSARFIVENPAVKVPYKHLDELKQLIAPVSFIVKKADCLDLPPKTYMKRMVSMTGDQLKAYTELKKDLLTKYGDITLTAANQLSLIVRLQQVTGGFFPGGVNEEGEYVVKPEPFVSNAKLEEMFEQLEETDDYPIIICARFIPEIKLILNALQRRRPELRCSYICGEVPTNQRGEILRRFSNKELDILIGNARTIGTGLNLQAAHTIFFYSCSFSFEERAQMEDRIHRHGQISDKVVYKDLIVKGTIDEKVYNAFIEHKSLLDYMRSTTVKEFIGGGS